MLAFESLTPQELLKEIAEYIRMEALRQNYVPAKTKLKRALDERAANALLLVAQALEGAAIIPANSMLRTSNGWSLHAPKPEAPAPNVDGPEGLINPPTPQHERLDSHPWDTLTPGRGEEADDNF